MRIAETQVERENKIFVGMLPKTATEQDLTNIFLAYGELREVHVIRGPEGGSKVANPGTVMRSFQLNLIIGLFF